MKSPPALIFEPHWIKQQLIYWNKLHTVNLHAAVPGLIVSELNKGIITKEYYYTIICIYLPLYYYIERKQVLI